MNPPPLEDVQRAVGDRYEVLDLAGAGGMGAVFRARHRELGHIVAVKVLPPDIAASRHRQERFRREASLAARMQHPHLVPVYEFETRAGLTYLIMPFVRGITLERQLETGRLGRDATLQLLHDIGAALDALHREGIVHRDVKPGNILMEDGTERALLTDFGLARTQGDASLTAPGTPLGTPDYMSPEQATGERGVDGRADLYALAIVAYEALTGALPAQRGDRATLAGALQAAAPTVNRSLAELLVAPLADQPSDRPATAAAWLSGLERAQRDRRTRVVQIVLAAVGLATLALAGAVALRNRTAPANPPLVAVMPFAVLGKSPYPSSQLPEYFLTRFSPVDALAGGVSFGKVLAETGGEPVSETDAEEIARRVGAGYYLIPSVAFTGDSVTLSATLYEVGKRTPRAGGSAKGAVGAMSTVMDAVWAKILGAGFAPNRFETLPSGKDAIASYINADVAFRRGAYDAARAGYDAVIAADSTFALARFRRALVIAQTDPTGELVRQALRGAMQHQSGLSRADSLMLDGYALLLERGDGRAALARFRAAAEAEPDEPIAWFVLGEFHEHFGNLFDQELDEAWTAFNRVRDLVPQFAPALAHLATLAYLRGDAKYTKQLMDEYQRLDSTSVVATVMGVADTLLFAGAPARARLVNRGLETRRFDVLALLAFQAAVAGSDVDRRGPGRRVLRALEARAASESERVRALRMGVAADLRYGWADSARARLARAASNATAQERDLWILLADAAALDPLGDPARAARRVADRLASTPDTAPEALWLLALAAGTPAQGAADRLRAMAADSAPLPVSLVLSLDARRHLMGGDTVGALARWDSATRRFDVLGVPFGLVASLWPQRLAIVRVAAAVGDTARAVRACATFASPFGYTDQVALPEAQRLCAPFRGISSASPPPPPRSAGAAPR